jgi:hypothetical protein
MPQLSYYIHNVQIYVKYYVLETLLQHGFHFLYDSYVA